MESLETDIRHAVILSHLPCEAAFAVARSRSTRPETVAETAGGMGIRIAACQLGLFGYDAFGSKRWIGPMVQVPADLEADVRASSPDGRISCAAAWQLAERWRISRLIVGSVLETLGVHVTACQLGCFR